ncbi:hypothetical protein [Gracilibacillus oryzae]|uniref:hypothetical protein n=1 Tax=Gracilibacillus oryzae TaxID=1672701 RepID=UPI00129564ED|nr:hypothetical protein [Gracilibacillus oryzae]
MMHSTQNGGESQWSKIHTHQGKSCMVKEKDLINKEEEKLLPIQETKTINQQYELAVMATAGFSYILPIGNQS